MNKSYRIFLLIVAIALTLISLLLIWNFISLKAASANNSLGHMKGIESYIGILTFLTIAPTVLAWIIILRFRKKS